MKKIRVCIYQDYPGAIISRNKVSKIREFAPHFLCFGEYFFTSKRIKQFTQTIHIRDLQMMRICTLSRALDCTVIGGTMPDIRDNKIYNTSYIFDRGKLLGSYDKINLFQREKESVTPGNSFRTFRANGTKFGIMICADVLTDEGFIFMKKNRAGIVFAPTLSPKKNESVEEKYMRDENIYVRGAKLSDAVIVKSCTAPPEDKSKIQARSLIASKDGIIFRVTPEQESESLLIMNEITL